MAAPIVRYSDPRLYGASLTQPFNASYEWIRTVSHPLHPECSLVKECFVRAIKILTGTLSLALTALPALAGRAIQILHYHAKSRESRLIPPEVQVNGLSLPGSLIRCNLPAPKIYHGTDKDGAIGILRWGFNPERSSVGSVMGEAVYVSAAKTVSAEYGDGQLVLELNLRQQEVAFVNNDDLNSHISSKEDMAKIRKLFLKNGYRAVKYTLDSRYGSEEAWAVYDPSCITLKQINPSPRATPNSIGVMAYPGGFIST